VISSPDGTQQTEHNITGCSGIACALTGRGIPRLRHLRAAPDENSAGFTVLGAERQSGWLLHLPGQRLVQSPEKSEDETYDLNMVE